MILTRRKGRKNLFHPLAKRTGVVFVIGLIVFGGLMGDRLKEHSRDNHYVYMADGFLDGRLHLEGHPPHLNDWAKYGEKWYVSFPPAPAVLMIPGVALFGLDFNDRLFTLFFAAAGPALLFLLLNLLLASGRISRRPFELYLLAAVYGIGSVYFFSAVQGSVWYTAHMVAGVLILLYAIFALDGKHPLVAGIFLGLAFMCRPPVLLAFPFFLHELLRDNTSDEPMGFFPWLKNRIHAIGAARLARSCAKFALPVLVAISFLMLMNYYRFDDPFEFGHKHLQIRWRQRIETWGLFNYHYLARNLSVALTLLPWIGAEEPYIGISRHGLAIWFTTPILLYALFPKDPSRCYRVLAFTVAAVALPSLLYQNSGWLQFGYRFSLDYMVFLMLMIAASKRRFGKLFMALCVFALVVNLFGAWTFDREWKYYPAKSTSTYFQPD